MELDKQQIKRLRERHPVSYTHLDVYKRQDEERAAKDAAFQEQGLVVASGLLGGESIVGVILAFVSVGLSLLG